MKALSVLFATFVTGALAAVPADAAWFSLQIKSCVDNSATKPYKCQHFSSSKVPSAVPHVNNLYLSSRDGRVAAYAGSREMAETAGKFFTTEYRPTNTLSLHFDDDTHQLALQRNEPGLLRLMDLVNPTAESLGGKPTMWSVFEIARDGSLKVNDGSVIPTRTWISYLDVDGVYYISLWDGVTKLPRSFANITLYAQKAQAPMPVTKLL